MAEQKEPPWLQRAVEILYDPLFGKLIEIDDDIPAENNIHFPEKEKPVLIIKIEPAEGHKLPYPVGYPVPAILFMKVTVLVKRFGDPERGVAVNPLARLVQDTLTDVGTDYLYLPAREFRSFKKKYRNCIRLFSRRTAGAPDSQYPFATCPFFENNFRDNFVSKRFQLKRLTKEICLVGCKEVHYIGELLIPVQVIPQIVVVIMKCREPMVRQPGRKPSLKQESVVIRKIQTTVVIYEITQEPELLVPHLYVRVSKEQHQYLLKSV